MPDLASVALPLATALPEEDDFEWLENGVEAAQHLGNLGVQSDTAQEVLPTHDETEAICSQVTAGAVRCSLHSVLVPAAMSALLALLQ